MEKPHVNTFFSPFIFSPTISLFWKPVQPRGNKSKGTERCTPSQWVVQPTGQLSILLLFSLPDLFMPVPDPTAHTGNKEALVASGLPDLGASSFNPVLYFIAQETFASEVSQGRDLLYKQWSECQQGWFVTERASPAKIPHVNAYTQTKLSFNWGWTCGVLQTWLSLSTFYFRCFAGAIPSTFMDIFPNPVWTQAYEGRFQTHKVSCEQEMLEL